MTLRTGLVGAGPWAQLAHAPALATAPDTRFSAIWARSSERAADLLATLPGADEVVVHDDLDAFFDAVDVVVFAVPPGVQQHVALRAARLGKHLLLEKPIALDLTIGRELVAAVEEAGVAATVFFTQQHLPAYRAWRDEQVRIGGWRSAHFERFAAVLTNPEGAFFGSAWRHEYGGWWDGAAHAIAHLITVLGDVRAVDAARGPGDLTDVILWHDSGARSTLTISFDSPVDVPGVDWLLGRSGKVELPAFDGPDDSAVQASRNAIATLLAIARDPAAPNPAGVRFGLRVLEVIEAGARSIDRGARIEV